MGRRSIVGPTGIAVPGSCLPESLINGPPEFPGFIGVWVLITSALCVPASSFQSKSFRIWLFRPLEAQYVAGYRSYDKELSRNLGDEAIRRRGLPALR